MGREALLDTPVPRWSDNTVGTGLDETPGTPGADPSLGLFRVWSTDGSFLRTETRFLTEGGTLDYPLTDAARAAQAAWDPLDQDNPFLTCIPKGMPTIMQQPNPVEFIDEVDRIVLLMEEFDAMRVIHMNDDADGQDARPPGWDTPPAIGKVTRLWCAPAESIGLISTRTACLRAKPWKPWSASR